jgi:hypothetical protein
MRSTYDLCTTIHFSVFKIQMIDLIGKSGFHMKNLVRDQFYIFLLFLKMVRKSLKCFLAILKIVKKF